QGRPLLTGCIFPSLGARVRWRWRPGRRSASLAMMGRERPLDVSPLSSASAAVTAPPLRGRRRSFAESVLSVRELPPAFGLLAVVLFFTLQTGNFWSPQTMTAITTVASTIAIVSVGVTMLMISGEFDLSVGQNFAFTPIVWAILFVSNGMNEWLAL